MSVTVAARFISVLFHPLLMATYLFLLLSYTLPVALDPVPMDGHQSFILLIFIVTFVVPAMNVLIFKVTGSLASVNFYDRKDRLIPFSVLTFFYGLITYFFYAKFKIGWHDNILRLMIVLDALVLITTLVTFFYKVSVHSLCMWGFLGIVLFLNKMSESNLLLIPLVSLFIATGMVMSSRLQLQAHTATEIWLGAALGFGASFLLMAILF